MTTQEKTGQSRQAAMYRLFAEDGTLLYIGSSFDPARRWESHKRAEWWPRVASRNVTWYSSRAVAFSAERAAIRREAPVYNTASTPAGNAQKAVRQQLTRPQASEKGKVARDGKALRGKVMKRLMSAGQPEAEARRAGLLAERAYKQASGLFSNGVHYPPLSWIK